MEESQPSPSPQKEVLIIPLHPDAAPLSPAQQTSSLTSPQTTANTTPSSPQTTPTASSPQTTPNAPTPRGAAGSQLFSELLAHHARRHPQGPEALASIDATPPSVTTPSPVATPQSLSPTPTSSPQQPSSTVPGSQLFSELLAHHARRHPQGLEALPSIDTTPPSVTTPSPVATPQSLSPTPTSSPQQPSSTVPGGLGLGSPELLKELKQPHTLKHVSAHKGLTTVFSGRGRTPSASSPTSGGGQKPQHLSNGTQH